MRTIFSSTDQKQVAAISTCWSFSLEIGTFFSKCLINWTNVSLCNLIKYNYCQAIWQYQIKTCKVVVEKRTYINLNVTLSRCLLDLYWNISNFFQTIFSSVSRHTLNNSSTSPRKERLVGQQILDQLITNNKKNRQQARSKCRIALARVNW